LRFLAPEGRHVAPIGVKFGTEEGTKSPSSVPNFTPSVQRQPCRTPITEVLLRFDQNVEYKRPAGAYPARDFHKICRVCTPFQDALAAKIWLDLLEGYAVIVCFNLRGSGFPQIFTAPSGETVRQTPKNFRGARTCSGSSITVPRLVELGFHPPPGWPKTLIFCLFLCLSVCSSRF